MKLSIVQQSIAFSEKTKQNLSFAGKHFVQTVTDLLLASAKNKKNEPFLTL